MGNFKKKKLGEKIGSGLVALKGNDEHAQVYFDQTKKGDMSENYNRFLMLLPKEAYILDFDNIDDIEYNICMSLFVDGYINYKEYSDIINLNYEEADRIIKLLNFDNYSIVKCKQKE